MNCRAVNISSSKTIIRQRANTNLVCLTGLGPLNANGSDFEFVTKSVSVIHVLLPH